MDGLRRDLRWNKPGDALSSDTQGDGRHKKSVTSPASWEVAQHGGEWMRRLLPGAWPRRWRRGGHPAERQGGRRASRHDGSIAAADTQYSLRAVTSQLRHTLTCELFWVTAIVHALTPLLRLCRFVWAPA